jgi:hypothetical protein
LENRLARVRRSPLGWTLNSLTALSFLSADCSLRAFLADVGGQAVAADREVASLLGEVHPGVLIETRIGNHTFRATGITAYLKNSGKLEVAQQIANHESPRITKLYDRRQDEISLDEIERITI